MRESKKTGMHGTLLNRFKYHQIRRKMCSEGQTGGPRNNLKFLFYAKLNAEKVCL